MKKNARNIIYVAAVAFALILIALSIHDTRKKTASPAYQADAPTSVKFAKLAEFIPENTEFDVTIDVERALKNPALRVRLMQITRERTGVGAELISALLENEKAIGLITIAGDLGNKLSPPRLFVIAQGQFDEDAMLPVIRAAMATDRAGVSAHDIKWSTIYYESDKRRPFGFMLLDHQHMAVGERETLETFFLEKPENAKDIRRMSDDVLFGHIAIGKRIKEIVPKMIIMPDTMDFYSDDGIMITARLLCTDQVQAMSVRMFLEGVRSLMILQHERNALLLSIVEGITIKSEGKDVVLDSKLAPLLNLWGSEPKKL
jgi:hypothetical protein